MIYKRSYKLLILEILQVASVMMLLGTAYSNKSQIVKYIVIVAFPLCLLRVAIYFYRKWKINDVKTVEIDKENSLLIINVSNKIYFQENLDSIALNLRKSKSNLLYPTYDLTVRNKYKEVSIYGYYFNCDAIYKIIKETGG